MTHGQESTFCMLSATLLLISQKWKLVKLVYLNFFKFFWHFEGSLFQKFAWKTEMEEQVIVRLMMVSWLRKMDFK